MHVRDVTKPKNTEKEKDSKKSNDWRKNSSRPAGRPGRTKYRPLSDALVGNPICE